MGKKFLIIALALFYTGVFGQVNVLKFNSPVAPSPTAASLGKYGDIPTSNYTGVPKITVPVYDIKVGSNVVPVNLSYHAGGFKIADESSWIGLGWSLNAGGVITRAKKMNDDLSAKGYFKRPDHTQIGDGSDKEQDMFYFNFLNLSGKFVIDYNSDPNQPYTIRIIASYDEDNLKINLVNNSTWKITDKYGVVYQFNVTEMTHDVEVSQGTYSGSSLVTDYISSWYLSKITYTNGEEIVLNYNDGPQIQALTNVDNIETRRTGYSTSAPTQCYQVPYNVGFGIDFTTTTHVATVNEKVLNEIVFPGGKVSFNSISDRVDLRSNTGSSERLSNIQVYSQNSSGFDLVKTFQFTQSYFSSSSRENYLSKRLRLDQFAEVGMTSQPSKYNFIYNDILLPDKDSKDMDHWGYYNGPHGNISLMPYESYRRPDPNYVKAGILRLITYPTNGMTEFFFEINDFSNLGTSLSWTSANAGNTGLIGAGVRVQKIINSKNYISYADDNIYNEKQFVYLKNINGAVSSSGQIMSKINYSIPFSTIAYVPYLSGTCAQYSSTPIRITGDTYFATSSVPISGDAQGNVIGYDNVIVKNIGLAGIENTTAESYINASEASLQIYPRIPSTNKNSNGLLKTKTQNVIKNGIEYPVKGFIYEYTTQTSLTIPNYIISFNFVGNAGVQAYNLACEWITLSKITEKDFQPVTSTESVVKTKSILYNTSNRQKKQEDFVDSKNITYSTKYLYPSDMISQGILSPYQSMQDRNMLAPVVQVEKYKGNLLLGKTYTDYNANWPGNPNLILPCIIRSQYMSNAPEARLNYNAYDAKGNPLTVSYERGVKTSYLWSYDGHYPIAEIKNTSYTDIENVLGAANIVAFANQHNPTIAMIDDFLAPLRTTFSNIELVSYYYQPLVGLIRQKDAKGMSTYYEYDDLQRLKYIRDNDKNIIKSFKYHFYELDLHPPGTISGRYGNPIPSTGYLSGL